MTTAKFRRARNGLYLPTTVVTYASALAAIGTIVGDWFLDDTSGSAAVAAVGSNGTYVASPTLGATGLLSGGGTAVTFDGNTQECTFPKPAGLTGNGVLVCNYKTSDGSNVNVVFRDATSASGAGYLIDEGATQTNPQVRIGGNNNVAALSVTSASLRDGAGHMFMIGLDGTNQKIWIDGVLVQTQARTNTWAGATGPFHIGRNGTNAGTANFAAGTHDRFTLLTISSMPSDAQAAALWAAR